MIINCPECDLPVSDKARSCPHCGFPINGNKNENINPKKRKKLPNGFGQITKLKNPNLKNPYRASITVGKTPEGRPIVKLLPGKAYFPTYKEAYLALEKYHKHPADFGIDMTVEQLYEKWSEKHFAKLSSASGIRTYQSSWAYCRSIYDMPVRKLGVRHIKYCMEHGTSNVKGEIKTPSANVQRIIKSTFNQMLDYALEWEIVDRNVAKNFKLDDEIVRSSNPPEKAHIIFTDDEMQLLWNNIYKYDYIDALLIQCYSGWRPQELCILKVEDVDLKKWTFKGGMKTRAGKDRTVPIHTKIRPLVEKRYKEAVKFGSEYLIYSTKHGVYYGHLNYNKYHYNFRGLVKFLGLNPEHKPHDGRKHFITLCKNNKVDEYAIKYMVGHEISDITEKIYTERDENWLQKEIEKIR